MTTEPHAQEINSDILRMWLSGYILEQICSSWAYVAVPAIVSVYDDIFCVYVCVRAYMYPLEYLLYIYINAYTYVHVHAFMKKTYMNNMYAKIR